MKIIKASIKNLDTNNTPLCTLAQKMSIASVIMINSRIFKYTSLNNKSPLFTIFDLQDAFFELAKKENIDGQIISSSYKESQCYILSCFSNKNTYLTTEQATASSHFFWNEVAHHFPLPPTHVFQHIPTGCSLFSGIMWEFCFIYLNDTTKDGIVIAASAWD